MQRGVEQCEGEQKQTAAYEMAPGRVFQLKGAVGEPGDGEDDDTGDTEPDAGKEHLAAGHVGGDGKLGKAQMING